MSIPLRRARFTRHVPAWKRFVGAAGGALLGAVLLVAAGTKAIDPAGFAEIVEREGVAVLGAPGATVIAAIALEAALGAALLLGVRRLWVLMPAALLVAFFLFLTGRAYWAAAHGGVDVAADCGCFGNLLERTPAQAFWQDLALLALPLALAFVGRPRDEAPPRRRLAAVAVVTAAAALLAWRAPSLPLDDWATRLRPGVALSEICAGAGPERVCLDTLLPELADGEHLVVVADIADPSFGDEVERLNVLAAGEIGPPLTVLTAAPSEQLRAFQWRFGPSFAVHEAPAALLRPLYRALPRSFRLADGKVTATAAGLPRLEP